MKSSYQTKLLSNQRKFLPINFVKIILLHSLLLNGHMKE